MESEKTTTKRRKRPKKITELYAKRKDIYKLANHKIACDNLTKVDISEKIIALYEKY